MMLAKVALVSPRAAIARSRMIIEAPPVPAKPGQHRAGAHQLYSVAEATPVQLKRHYAGIRQKIVLIRARGKWIRNLGRTGRPQCGCDAIVQRARKAEVQGHGKSSAGWQRSKFRLDSNKISHLEGRVWIENGSEQAIFAFFPVEQRNLPTMTQGKFSRPDRKRRTALFARLHLARSRAGMSSVAALLLHG